jgi:hypothetical protein
MTRENNKHVYVVTVVDSFHIMPDAYSSSLLDSMIASFVFTS